MKVGAFVLLSRILGLIRDSLIAFFIGAGNVSDAFYTAFRIPNMLRDLLGEGALSSVVVSRLGQLKEKKGEEEVNILIRKLFGFWAIVLLFISIIGIIMAPILVKIIATGFGDKVELFDLTVRLTRRMFPFIGMIGISALTMGVLHHKKIFGWSSAASSFLNLSIITLASICFYNFNPDATEMVFFLVYAFLIGSVFQWMSMWPGLYKTKTSIVPINPLTFLWKDPEVNKIFLMLGPSILGVAAVQINVLVNHNYASNLISGTITHHYYSFRLMQLPVGIVGVAVSTVLLPKLSEYFANQKHQQFEGEVSTALSKVAFLCIPAVAGLSMIGPELIAVLYERGEFTATATAGVWLALQGALLGILPYAWNKNLIQAFYARNDIRYPMFVSLSSILLNAGLNAYLAFKLDWGVFGLTLGTSIVLTTNTLALICGLSFRHKINLKFKPMIIQIATIIVATSFMILMILWIRNILPQDNKIVRLIIDTCVGLGSYFLIQFIFKKTKNRLSI